jgi:hypothetical protein
MSCVSVTAFSPSTMTDAYPAFQCFHSIFVHLSSSFYRIISPGEIHISKLTVSFILI